VSGPGTALTAPTEVFSADGEGRCCLAFLARRRYAAVDTRQRVLAALDRLRGRGWQLSVAEMFGEPSAPAAYDTGFAHDIDVAGIFEAPSLTEAVTGSLELEQAGWTELLRTEWLLGLREFGPVGRGPGGEWGFLALWEWNDAWQDAGAQARADYDAECDIAFASDLAAGARIAGRHRLDWASRWHHLGVWEVADPGVIDAAMREHERVADFKFTTSRHYLGRKRPLADLLEEASHA
jgi:hypothetical protein